jgi:hypothetical protein
MTSTKENPGPFDGLERAAPDEPVFTLRAKDPLAAKLVRDWVQLRRFATAVADMPEDARALELTQISEAEQISWDMDDWRNGASTLGVATVTVEQPSTERTSHGETMCADELAAKKKWDAIKDASRRLDNCVSDLDDLSKELPALGFNQLTADMNAALDGVIYVAESVKPRRASYAHNVPS